MDCGPSSLYVFLACLLRTWWCIFNLIFLNNFFVLFPEHSIKNSCRFFHYNLHVNKMFQKSENDSISIFLFLYITQQSFQVDLTITVFCYTFYFFLNSSYMHASVYIFKNVIIMSSSSSIK